MVLPTEPVLPPPGWNLILRLERSNLEAGTTWWRANTCHFDFSRANNTKAKIKAQLTP